MTNVDIPQTKSKPPRGGITPIATSVACDPKQRLSYEGNSAIYPRPAPFSRVTCVSIYGGGTAPTLYIFMEYDEGYSHQRVKLSTCAVSGICEASIRFAFLSHPVGGSLDLEIAKCAWIASTTTHQRPLHAPPSASPEPQVCA